MKLLLLEAGAVTGNEEPVVDFISQELDGVCGAGVRDSVATGTNLSRLRAAVLFPDWLR